MKRILTGITILGVGGALVFNVIQGNRGEYVAGTATSTAEVVIEETEETYPDEVLQASSEAAQAVLRAFELEQDRIHIVEEMEAKKAEYDLYVKEQEQRLEDIEGQLSF